MRSDIRFCSSLACIHNSPQRAETPQIRISLPPAAPLDRQHHPERRHRGGKGPLHLGRIHLTTQSMTILAELWREWRHTQRQKTRKTPSRSRPGAIPKKRMSLKVAYVTVNLYAVMSPSCMTLTTSNPALPQRKSPPPNVHPRGSKGQNFRNRHRIQGTWSDRTSEAR